MSTKTGGGSGARRPDADTAAPAADGDAAVLMEVAAVEGVGGVRLSGLSLTLSPGAFRLLYGARGAGKHVLLDLAAGMIPPSGGRVLVFGRDARVFTRADRAAAARRIGRVFADDRLLDHLSVFDNVALPLRIAGVNRRTLRQRVTDMLDWIGLADVSAASPSQLPQDRRRLAAVARAVVGQPQLILAHTPLRDLSATSAAAVMFLLEELAGQGAAVIVALNDDDATRASGHVLHLRDGRLRSEEPAAGASRRAGKSA